MAAVGELPVGGEFGHAWPARRCNQIELGLFEPAAADVPGDVEIAGVVAFLACSNAGYMTDAQIPVGGGLSAMNGQPRIEM
ncbi:hypothetical protein ACFO9E_11090 [Streptomyces maoxianensis]|uniref:SDR family oxidoreductase n=1 Tax=Streptomyces maoxianensis TaxID=1459942 RepID=A0ABV9G1Z4_9ACTN